MSGKVEELGYRGQRQRASRCRGCKQVIQWGVMFGKRHPFNLDGTSHFDSCPEADGFRKGGGVSLRVRGDLDTFYRQRWVKAHCGDLITIGFDRSVLWECPLPAERSEALANLLCAVGGPLYYACWSVARIQSGFGTGLCTVFGDLEAVVCDLGLMYRLRDYFRDDAVRVYKVSGLYLVGEGSDA